MTMAEANENTISELDGEERGIPSVAARKKEGGGDIGKKIVGALFLVLPLIALGAWGYFKYFASSSDAVEKEDEKAAAVVKPPTIPAKTFVLEPEPAPAAPPVAAVEEQQEAAPPPRKGDTAASGASGGGAPRISKSGRQIALAGGGGSAIGGAGGQGRAAPFQEENDRRLREAESALFAAGAGGGAEKGALGGMLQSTSTRTNYASHMGDRNYIIAKGTILQCALQTKIVTSVAGMIKCVMPTNVFSDNGKVLLMERGSEITGEYQAGLKQGQSRIFVLWDRIKTPSGVRVELASPGTGPLGEAGVDGHINTHFWKRFGGAIMLSLIDDLGNSAARESTSANINLGGTSDAASDMAAEALKSSINIPPTLSKNQGEAVAIYLARDLDFRGVYDLAPQR